MQTGDGPETTYIYDANDQLQEVWVGTNLTVEYDYDENGNLIEERANGEVLTYKWDDQNRLVEVLKDGVSVASYEYDDDNIRVSQTVDGETTEFVVDKNRAYAQVLAEYVGSQLIEEYVYGLDLIEQTDGSGEKFFGVDGLGSTVVLTDENGEVLQTYEYDEFGELEDVLGDLETDYLFAGEQFDEALGDYYLRQRYYDPTIGRFTRRDTYEGRLNEPITLNKFVYANSDPVSYIDPSGLVSFLTRKQRKELGNEIHERIGQDFVRQAPRRGADLKGQGNGLTIKKILREADGLPNGHPGFNRLRPDLADYAAREIYEIKSKSKAAIAFAEAMIYEAALNRAPGQTNDWSAGTASTYTFARNPIVLPYGKIAIVAPPVQGVMLYHLHDNKNSSNSSTSTSSTIDSITFAILAAMVAAAAVRGQRTGGFA